MTDWEFTGDRVGEQVMQTIWSTPQLLSTFVKRRFLNPKATERRRFVETAAAFDSGFRQTEFFRSVFKPNGIEDQIRMLVYDGDVFVGWLGALRLSRSFSAADRRRLAPHGARLRAGMIAIDRMMRGLRPATPGCIIARSDGAVEFVDDSGRAWLDTLIPPPLFRTAMNTFLGDTKTEVAFAMGGADVRATRVHATDSVRWVMRLTPATPLRSAPDATLSPLQRQVAESAAAGMTLPEIAKSLGRSHETIRSHLRQVYGRLGISSRVELINALQRKDNSRR